MRQIGVHGMILSERKDENFHPGKSEMIHDLSDIRGNEPEIFRHNRKVREVFIQGVQKLFHWNLHPPSR